MATDFDKDIASAILDELETQLKAWIKRGGFDNKAVIWMIKAWTKAGMYLRGDSYHAKCCTYFRMKRTPQPTHQKRSQVLLSAINAYTDMLNKHGTTEGDFFNRAERAMIDFVWEYHSHISQLADRNRTENEFIAMLVRWQNLTVEEVKKQAVTGSERHA